MESIPQRVREKLKYYVYLYVDPRDGQPFYVGKGRGNRALSHLHDTTDTAKAKRIVELKKLAQDPIIEILKHGMTEKEAFLVEAAAIDLLGLDELTNRVKGHGAVGNRRIRLDELVQELDAKEVEIAVNAILININNLYRYGMSEIELYDATRASWKIGARRDKAEYAFSVYRGIVREVYFIAAWVPACSTMLAFKHREDEDIADPPERYEFVGKPADKKMRRKYVGKSVKEYFPQGSQNPIRYVNC